MIITVPDISWYRTKSIAKNAPFACPYANVHKCYRYYTSIFMLGEAQMITSIMDDKKVELDNFWLKTNLPPVIAEEDTCISGSNDRWTSFSNFCPEVSYSYFGLYASYLAKYVDDIDKDIGHRTAAREGIKNDWRYVWGFLSSCHFLDCSVYNQVDIFNSQKTGKLDQLVHSNIVILLGRMEQCLENQDPSGVLHAASNILETMAKDILGGETLANQSLGGFIDKYNKESNLPNVIKSVVGNIYNLRNKMPLSGHGNTQIPNMDIHDAIIIAATTKFIVEIEYRLKDF